MSPVEPTIVRAHLEERAANELDPTDRVRGLELALESARAGVWDSDGALEERRPSAFIYRMLGVEPEVGRREPRFWSSRIHPQDHPGLRRTLQRTIAGEQEGYELEYRVRHADGTYRWVLDRGRVLERDAKRRARRLVGFLVETTDRVQRRTLAEQERRNLEREIIETANREQQRIGSDLHDGLGQELTGIALMLRAVGVQLSKDGSPACADIEQVITLVNAAIESTRALARGLSPVSAELEGFTAALQSLASRVSARHDIPVSFESRLTQPLRLSETAATHLYRIAQEALTNALRHSHASQVHIRLDATDRELLLLVEDDGLGLPGALERSNGGLGLKIMRYRAQMLGGDLVLEGGADGGTAVRCCCPLGR
jgi:PAS domain S-box-containing protein